MPKEKKIFIVSAAVFAVVIVFALVFFVKYLGARSEISNLRDNPNARAEQEVKDLVARVGALMVLPADETPTVATVQDPELLKRQTFFQNAKKGDKVLIYAKAGKAILFDPAAGKIVEVAPLTFGPRNP